MLRENLVGVILDLGIEGNDSVRPVVLVEFAGEGAEAVVYAYAELDDLSKSGWVLKLLKPLPMLEMETLHHSLRIHEEAYPSHPLLMSAQARLDMLTAEMLTRVDNGHLLFRVELYYQVLRATVEVLAGACAEPFARGEVLGPTLDRSPAREWLDDNLIQHIEELLDEDSIVESHRPLVETMRDEIESGIERWKAACTYFPLSRNPLVNLVGLFAEDFISSDELRYISRTQEFAARLAPEHGRGLFDLIATLYFHLEGRPDGETTETDATSRRQLHVPVAACDLLAEIGTRHLAGLAHLWKARLLLLGGDADVPKVEQIVRSALNVLDEPAAQPDRHDTLLLLAELTWRTNRRAARRYLREANRIRQAING